MFVCMMELDILWLVRAHPAPLHMGDRLPKMNRREINACRSTAHSWSRVEVLHCLAW
jgi:hypothetical protein